MRDYVAPEVGGRGVAVEEYQGWRMVAVGGGAGVDVGHFGAEDVLALEGEGEGRGYFFDVGRHV